MLDALLVVSLSYFTVIRRTGLEVLASEEAQAVVSVLSLHGANDGDFFAVVLVSFGTH